MATKIILPLRLLHNFLIVLDGIYVYPEAPVGPRPAGPGPYRAVIDTGSGNSWIKPEIGGSFESYPADDLVIDKGKDSESGFVDVKFGFMKDLSGKPVKGWVQLDPRLSTYSNMLICGDFGMPDVDLLIGMDTLCSFARSAVVVEGVDRQFLVVEDKT